MEDGESTRLSKLGDNSKILLENEKRHTEDHRLGRNDATPSTTSRLLDGLERQQERSTEQRIYRLVTYISRSVAIPE